MNIEVARALNGASRRGGYGRRGNLDYRPGVVGTWRGYRVLMASRCPPYLVGIGPAARKVHSTRAVFICWGRQRVVGWKGHAWCGSTLVNPLLLTEAEAEALGRTICWKCQGTVAHRRQNTSA